MSTSGSANTGKMDSTGDKKVRKVSFFTAATSIQLYYPRESFHCQ